MEYWCLLKHYKNVDFTFKNKKPFNFPIGFFKNDLMNKNCYLKFWNEYDLVFIKGNRVNILKDN